MTAAAGPADAWAAGWPAAAMLASFGATLGVRADDPAALDALRAAPPTGVRVVPVSDARVHAVYTWTTEPDAPGGPARDAVTAEECDAPARTVAAGDRAAALTLLRHDAEFLTAVHATEAVFVHAGVVEWRGRAVVCPGASFAGKSTLVAALLRAGAGYLSDEYAVLLPDGRVHPFARPLALRSADGGTTTRVPAAALGAQVIETALPLGAVVSTRWAPEVHWAPRSLTPGEAALALAEHTVVARSAPRRTLAHLGRALAAGPVVALAGPRGDAGATARRLLADLDGLFAEAGPAGTRG